MYAYYLKTDNVVLYILISFPRRTDNMIQEISEQQALPNTFARHYVEYFLLPLDMLLQINMNNR